MTASSVPAPPRGAGLRSLVTRATPRLRWCVAFTMFAGLGLAWTFATPVFASPDEPSHVFHALGMANGQLFGRDVPPELQTSSRDEASFAVEVPAVYKDWGHIECLAYRPQVTANCMHFQNRAGDTEVRTYTARYPPPYFVLVGFGSAWFPAGVNQIYLMRAIGALLVAALLASCITTIIEVRAIGAALGLLVALTPAVYFFAGVVNPTSVEIAAGIATWVHGAALVTARGPEVSARLIRRLGIAACILCVARPLSPVWVVLIGCVLALAAGRARLLEIAQARAARLWAGAIVATFGAWVIWTVSADTLGEGHFLGTGTDASWTRIVQYSFGRSFLMVQQMIGNFGWLDTPSPTGTYVLWLVALGALVGLALLVGRGRVLLALLTAVGIALVVPVVMESLRARSVGYIWQGRYALPFAVGIPILAGMALRYADDLEDAIMRAARVIVAALIAAQMLAFGQALRRNTVGAKGSLQFLTGTSWSPPLPTWFLLLVYLCLLTAIAWWALSAMVRRGSDDEPDPAPPTLAGAVSADGPATEQ